MTRVYSLGYLAPTGYIDISNPTLNKSILSDLKAYLENYDLDKLPCKTAEDPESDIMARIKLHECAAGHIREDVTMYLAGVLAIPPDEVSTKYNPTISMSINYLVGKLLRNSKGGKNYRLDYLEELLLR